VFGLFRRSGRRQAEAPPAIPAGHRVYAIGDVHGRADLLDRLVALIEDDARPEPGRQDHLVFLGDYVDRGLDSHGVVERLANADQDRFGTIFLKGNHEDALLRFLEDPGIGPMWLQFGGQATLYSYGVRRPDGLTEADFLAHAQAELRRRIPPRHLAFLQDLHLQVTIGDYLFVHAGVRPGVPLDRQSEEDLMWIRDEFLHSPARHGKMVVHGHSISEEPDVKANRIGIDTGAFATGRLTCLVLEGTERRFLVT
jgi:serine/threonine protein phosphatase 1